MELSIPVLVAVGVLLAGLAVLLLRRGGDSRDLMAPPGSGQRDGGFRSAPSQPAPQPTREPEVTEVAPAEAASEPQAEPEALPPFFTANMETALDRAQGFAGAAGSLLVTLDHLLLALADEPDALRALKSRGADPAALRTALQARIAAEPTQPDAAAEMEADPMDEEPAEDEETRSTDEVQRVLQRTILKTFELRRPADGADVLESLLQEGGAAVQLLRQCGLADRSEA